MPKTRPLPRVNEDEKPATSSPALLIRDNLLRAIGEPADFFQLQVKSLWGDYFRANVLVGTFTECKVARSYFIKATPDGEIVTAVPAIKREY
jgi:hypothetical protein